MLICNDAVAAALVFEINEAASKITIQGARYPEQNDRLTGR